jgi:nicotinate-nucleotide adenylyltransferase
MLNVEWGTLDFQTLNIHHSPFNTYVSKIAVLGGSFNPPHICHVFICYYVFATTDVDQTWVVPCYRHAFGKKLAPFQHRLTMCRLAMESLREGVVLVSAIEEERQGISWTIDTVRYLRNKYPEHEFRWIIGSDVLDEFDTWKDVDQLRQLISFIVVPRAGSHVGDPEGFQLPNISSTLIRERIKQQKSIHHLVPKKIETYIRLHKLYSNEQ